MNGPNKLECYIKKRLEGVARYKFSSFFGQFVCDEENEVFLIWLLWLYLQHIIFFVTYKFAQ